MPGTLGKGGSPCAETVVDSSVFEASGPSFTSITAVAAVANSLSLISPQSDKLTSCFSRVVTLNHNLIVEPPAVHTTHCRRFEVGNWRKVASFC